VPGYGPPPQGYGYGRPQGEDTTWAVLAHLSAYVAPFLGPLAIYLIKRDESPMTRHHAAEALNFHICLTIYAVVSFVLVFVLVGFFLLAAVAIAGFVMPILGALAASRREAYRYPLTIHFLS
jgi:uncharacterized Tic20 family protein